MQQQPRTMISTHPLRIGALYGLGLAVLQLGIIKLNHQFLDANGIVGFFTVFLLPLIGLYLAGHFSGRQERINLSTTVTSGLRSTLHGTSAGIITALVYIILVGILTKVLAPTGVVYTPKSSDSLANLINGAGYVIGIFVWPIVGLLFGTIGGFFGDNQAHTQLKKGTVTAAPKA